MVAINVITMIVPPSTLMVSNTVTATLMVQLYRFQWTSSTVLPSIYIHIYSNTLTRAISAVIEDGYF